MEPFLGFIQVFGFSFAPRGWAMCNGQILPINSNQSLFSLLGTTFGGDGRTTLALPDLRGRTMIGSSSALALGRRGGAETHRLTEAQIPSHTHTAALRLADSSPRSSSAVDQRLANNVRGENIFSAANRMATTAVGSVVSTATGSNLDFNMRQPYVAVNICIALQGLFPSRN